MKVRYTPRARADLNAIFPYISADDRRAAEKVVAAIKKAAELIGKNPKRGHKTENPSVLRVPVIRYPYAIYSRAREDGVYVVHMRHSSRGWPKAGNL